jgi:hypothetical protein
MTSFDHYTIHVGVGILGSTQLEKFFSLLQFDEIPPNDPYEHDWKVRWFRPRFGGPNVHVIETDDGEKDMIALGHFCLKFDTQERVDSMEQVARQRDWLERASGSGRIWLSFGNIRVEVRP